MKIFEQNLFEPATLNDVLAVPPAAGQASLAAKKFCTRKSRFILFLIVLLWLLQRPAYASSQQLTYTPSSEDFPNPERGFMKQSSIYPDQPFDPNKIRALQPSDTVVWIYFRLDNYRNRVIDQNGLNNIKATFTTARNKGIKLVIRFIYNWGPGSTTDPNQANPDAPLDLVLHHIGQLKPILVENTDVIVALQAGFVGHWGEWHSSKYLNAPETRKAIVDTLLAALPKERMLQLRYPRYKEMFFQGPLTETQAFSGTDASRVGHHNDCFLRDQDDTTYRSRTGQAPAHGSTYCTGQDEIACWKGFVAQEGRFTPVGGETCQFNPPRTECPNAQQELEILHWSFINNGYRKEVLDGWLAGGCMDTIRRRLGYRLVLQNAVIPQSVQPGGSLQLTIQLSNQGYAAMFNPRSVLLVLQNASNRYEISLPTLDPRRWEPGKEQTLNIDTALPTNIAAGMYKLGLWLPDQFSSLRNNPAYAVRFANTNVWEASTGLNILTSNLQVSSSPQPTVITVTPTTTPVSADLDNDHDVDIFDYNLLVPNFAQSSPNLADIDQSGKVDILDYNLLLVNLEPASEVHQ